jgi:hypothetical protein
MISGVNAGKRTATHHGSQGTPLQLPSLFEYLQEQQARRSPPIPEQVPGPYPPPPDMSWWENFLQSLPPGMQR